MMSGKNLILLLLATVTLMVLFVVGNFISTHIKEPSLYSLNISNQPTIGNKESDNEVVVFLDPKCPSCKNYNDMLFPKIQKEYIDTHKIKYTAITVSYMEGSMPIAEALLCTYYQDEGRVNSDLYFKFLNAIYQNETGDNHETANSLLEIAAKADSAINIDKIKKCTENEVYHTRLMQNNAEGARATSRDLKGLVMFVNGVRVDVNDPEKIFRALEENKNGKGNLK